MKAALGLALLTVAIYFIYQVLKSKKAIKACCGKTIVATVTDNVMRQIGGNIYLYYPIYAYEIDGEAHIYNGIWPAIKPLPLGGSVTFYYDDIEQMPIDTTAVAAQSTLVVVCGVASLILLSLSS